MFSCKVLLVFVLQFHALLGVGVGFDLLFKSNDYVTTNERIKFEQPLPFPLTGSYVSKKKKEMSCYILSNTVVYMLFFGHYMM